MSTDVINNRIHPLSSVDTSNLPPDGGPRYNRLIFETSPYLLQHATNPVDWYPWGEAAFALARQRQRPVFLSIGYATCHWCHVMEHESFEDEGVAAALNEGFVSIKVDREEHPDVDQHFMRVCQLMTGGGGWPLNLVLTPEREPFFSATYIPKLPHAGNYGLLQVLDAIKRIWINDRDRLNDSVAAIHTALEQLNGSAAPATLDDAPLNQALREYRRSYDPEHAGFGDAPKFPSPHQLSLLLRLASRYEDPDASAMALTTIKAIDRGGIHDHLGGGIHRYSVDNHWLVPHFEKMLYDQALCVIAAAEAWQHTPDEELKGFVRSLLDYLLRDMRHPQGGFYSGEDADSAGEEGRYYLWTPAEIRAALGTEDGELMTAYFGVKEAGNYEGRNILTRPASLASFAAASKVPAWQLSAKLEEARQRLLQTRERRARPLLDDKIVTAWNGLAIAALARAGSIFADERWLAAAAEAADFILTEIATADGHLLRCWRRGQSNAPAMLEDYAATAWGLLELHQATLAERWLKNAQRYVELLLELFADDEGGLFESPRDGSLQLRLRSWQDGAMPAGASMAAWVLLKVGRLTGDIKLEERGRQVLARQLGQAQHYPSAAALLLQALDFALGPVTEVTLHLQPGDQPERWLGPLRQQWQPRLLMHQPAVAMDRAASSAQICHKATCLPPVETPEALGAMLTSLPTS